MKQHHLITGALLCLITLFAACGRKNDLNNDRDFRLSEDLSINMDLDEATDLDEDIAVEDRGGGPCPIKTFANPAGTWPNTITVDFGDECVRPDGRVLKGKIIITQSDSSLRMPGATRQVSYDGFYVDGVHVEGSKNLSNNGFDADGHISITKVVNKTLTFTDGTTTSWEATKIKTLVEGLSTLNPLDNVWQITGSGSGTNRDGDNFTWEIIEPLTKRSDCRWVTQGTMAWTKNTRSGSLDFGDGTCDKFGTLTLANGESFVIKLHR